MNPESTRPELTRPQSASPQSTQLGLRSMTGQGSAVMEGEDFRVSAEVRAVNHRHLDLRVKLPSELSHLCAQVEAAVRGNLGRGRIELSAQLTWADSTGASVNMDAARHLYAQFVALRDELCPEQEVPLSLLAGAPGLFATGQKKVEDDLVQALVATCKLACERLEQMRRVEGDNLRTTFEDNLATLRGQMSQVESTRVERVDTYRARLEERVARLAENAGLQSHLAPGRLEQEVVVFAERCDVEEELTRLQSHCDLVQSLLGEQNSEGSPGRRLDFLLQEMSREVNTLGSKSPDAKVAQSVVEMKTAITRMREQAQNIL